VSGKPISRCVLGKSAISEWKDHYEKSFVFSKKTEGCREFCCCECLAIEGKLGGVIGIEGSILVNFITRSFNAYSPDGCIEK
jgi:hypothetical protein